MKKEKSKPSTKKYPKIISTKRWIIELTTYDDNTQTLNRTNDGFTALELLGLASRSQIEILHQMDGTIKPTTIKRNIIED